MSYLMDTVTKIDLVIDKAEDDILYSKNGKKYLDWFADVGTVNLGYYPKGLVDLFSQVPQHIPNTLKWEWKEIVTEKLCLLTKMEKAFYCNSGSEANEAALKIVRKSAYDKGISETRNTIYSVQGGFHGRTYGAMSLSDPASYHKEGFYPLLEKFSYFDIIEDINFSKAQAVFLATGFGNNTAYVYPVEFIQELREMTEKHSIPLVLDEVQVGAGRTGTFNFYDQYNVIPDIVCLGKGIACGIPTGVTLARNGYEKVLTPGTHYSTFGGSPFSIIGINHLITAWENGLPENIKKLSSIMVDFLEGINHITEVTGAGLWIGLKIEDDKAFQVSDRLLENGMFLPTFRPDGIKLTPMLNSTEESIKKGLVILKKSIYSVFGH